MVPPPHPARLSGELDEPLSRWLWLVKRLLSLPTSSWPSCGWHSQWSRGGLLRDPLHRPLSACLVRLQHGCTSLELASRLLRVRHPRHRPVPALHTRRRTRLSGALGTGVSRAAVQGSGAGEVVAVGHPSLLRARSAPGRPASALGTVRAHRSADLHRRVSAQHLRPCRRAEPLGTASRRLRGLADRRVSPPSGSIRAAWKRGPCDDHSCPGGRVAGETDGQDVA